ncbi:gated mechanosensitive channel [Gonapodya prolifera JEL478]|uniref:Gated mechanosensitive channel n=1 Tax=Gonapodya prolifera (strain JEL478) TaxID=1344416 RepID=A0A139A5B2_GONPJ|nr:gated mechanosensitive channel [Gonapodya prolifera JEL478]|eukprot:KXS11819.1 gated mechanosensitive channel [Gonapodya prolifera JEL478]
MASRGDTSIDTARIPMLDMDAASARPSREGVHHRAANTAKKGATAVYRGTRTLLGDFKSFVVRGHVIDLAIAVVMGAAFSAVVTSVVTDLFTPFIALATYHSSLPDSHVVLRQGKNGTATGRYDTIAAAKADGAITWNYGNFLNTLLSFVTISLVMFGLFKIVVLFYPVPKPMKECPDCLGEHKIGAKVCQHCRFRFPTHDPYDDKPHSIIDTAMHVMRKDRGVRGGGAGAGGREQGQGQRSETTLVGGKRDDDDMV